ncbi:MAG: dihydrofolate reductase [Sphingobacteriales bacterium]|nr:dihydrofolate reductase [Sphingobacteriales bacterium]
MTKRKLIVYIATSADGYIARSDDDLEWLQQVAREGEDYGYAAFIQSIDTVVLGRRTYEKVLQMGVVPHTDKRCFVLSAADGWHVPPDAPPTTQVYGSNLESFIAQLKAENSEKHIFCDGGAQVIQQLLRLQLIDEIIVSVIPVLLGRGIALFHNTAALPENTLLLLQCSAFESGLVQLHYRIKKNDAS